MQSYNQNTHAVEAISYRCADLDRIVPSLMGVSKARRPALLLIYNINPAGCAHLLPYFLNLTCLLCSLMFMQSRM